MKPALNRSRSTDLLALQLAANSAQLRQGLAIRDPEQRRLHDMKLRNAAEDEAAEPFAFPKRRDLRKSSDERRAMNEAYARCMSCFLYEAPAVRAQAARKISAWIAVNAMPRQTAEAICRNAAEAGALEL